MVNKKLFLEDYSIPFRTRGFPFRDVLPEWALEMVLILPQ